MWLFLAVGRKTELLVCGWRGVREVIKPQFPLMTSLCEDKALAPIKVLTASNRQKRSIAVITVMHLCLSPHHHQRPRHLCPLSSSTGFTKVTMWTTSAARDRPRSLNPSGQNCPPLTPVSKREIH